MRSRRQWEEIYAAKQPVCFEGSPVLSECSSSFPWVPMDFQAPEVHGTARMYYRNGWTALVFWNSRMYFVDRILTFDAMIELMAVRFGGDFVVNRDYGYGQD